MIQKIDTDSDGQISEAEMGVWIRSVAQKNQNDATAKHWFESNPEGKALLSWPDYEKKTYGGEEDRTEYPEYDQNMRNDKRRWALADQNKDGSLDKTEFNAFMHPQDIPYMASAVTDELMDIVDTNKDGFVSEEEYLADVARAYGDQWKPGQQPEADWVARERDQYKRYRDANGDGKMDKQEVADWIMPKNYDPFEAEVQHLFYHADANQDKQLTTEEILNQQDLFVSSEATNYGGELEHEEL